MQSSRSVIVLGIVAAILVFLVDQASKNYLLYVVGFIDCINCTSIRVLPVFDISMVWNPGISYGLFPAGSAAAKWLLIGFSVVMSIVLTGWLFRAESRWLGLGLGLVIGGALGNVLDRFLYGAVADFFYFHAFGYSWYVFNVADAAIVIGVIAILIDALFIGRRPAAPALEGVHDDAR